MVRHYEFLFIRTKAVYSVSGYVNRNKCKIIDSRLLKWELKCVGYI